MTVKLKKKKEIVKYLDYEIRNTWNGDGWVLCKPDGELWECHLGNFTTVEDAKKYAIASFMIARPQIFHSSIRFRMFGDGGSMHDYFLLKSTVEKLGLKMPADIKYKEMTFCILLEGGK